MATASIDYSLFRAVNGLSGSTLADDLLRALANDLAAVLVVLVALVFLVPWAERRSERRNGAVLATAAAPLALLINQPLSHLVARARPFVAHPAHTHLLLARSPDPSFPSDHATGAFALAFGVWLYDRTIGAVLLVLAALLSFARVYAGTHYPGDVVAGALVGIAIASLLHLVPPLRRLIEAIARRCGELLDGLLTGRRAGRVA
jgi:undecaprenyl-diphosphatase